MRGYPKHLNTKEDYIYVMQNFPRADWEGALRNLLATREDWFFDKTLASREEGAEDATHKIIENREPGAEGEETVTYSQYELRENPTCELYRLGFTVAEVEGLLAGK